MQGEDGFDIGEAALGDDAGDLLEGGAVVGYVGEIDDGEAVCRQSDHEIGEPASAARVEEEVGVAGGFEPAGRIITVWHTGNGEAKPSHDVGQPEEAVLLQALNPFGIIGEGGIDAAVAFGGAGDALVGHDDAAGGVACVTHRTMRDGVVLFIDRAAGHAQRLEDAVVYEPGVGFVRGALDDQRQQAEPGIAVAETAAGRKISGVVRRQQAQDVGIEDLGRSRRRDEVLIVEDAGGMSEEMADQDGLADMLRKLGQPAADGVVEVQFSIFFEE